MELARARSGSYLQILHFCHIDPFRQLHTPRSWRIHHYHNWKPASRVLHRSRNIYFHIHLCRFCPARNISRGRAKHSVLHALGTFG